MTPDEVSKARRLQREMNALYDRLEAAIRDPVTTNEGFEAMIQEAKNMEDEFYAHLRSCRS